MGSFLKTLKNEQKGKDDVNLQLKEILNETEQKLEEAIESRRISAEEKKSLLRRIEAMKEIKPTAAGVSSWPIPGSSNDWLTLPTSPHIAADVATISALSIAKSCSGCGYVFIEDASSMTTICPSCGATL